MSTYPEEFKALEEENKRLRAVLQEISDTEDEFLECGCGYSGFIDKIAKQALAKLKEEPEQGEFTKNIMTNLERWDLLPKEKDCRIRTIITWLKEVCRRYDWLVKRNAKLQAENKKLIEGQQARKEAGS